MTDIVDSQTRSRMMAAIRGKDTKPEMALRRSLHALGFRYRLHAKDILGKPDLVLAKYRAVIFVHGCFWHRHKGCRFASTPSTRAEFWQEKFKANVERDERARLGLLSSGWRVATIWECQLRSSVALNALGVEVSEWLTSGGTEFVAD